MNLRRLSHVVTLADELHFGRAAERVNLSQPAFSRSIQSVESDVGARLFDRDATEVRLTPAGEFFIPRARALLLDARSLERDVNLYLDVEIGEAAFGCGPIPAVDLMPQVISMLRQSHPRVTLRVEESNWKHLLERLRTEDIEFFVADTTDLPQDPALHVQALPRQRIGFYVRARHPLAARSCTLAEAWQMGVAAAKAPIGLKERLAALLGTPGEQLPNLALECDNFAILRSVALSSDTVLAATESLVQDDLAAGRLMALRMKTPASLHTKLAIVRLQNRTPSPMARVAMAYIERVVREPAAS
ncbi:LysR family transcriptional regulator [Variovorax sp. Sphag1AA]|uniref:LysR family transcriptional regulator n=1 Tax=Variovorax sp. Sphag1AA TaxID=2587027 RepID=UPI001621FBFB|nr:LysR family transcriptional regulator [Variovorax sp. Sphag1AA]MBB3178059.1 DNA-binding transcriptional LysR family regulator [Variovorax sp. Sphag1AA]